MGGIWDQRICQDHPEQVSKEQPPHRCELHGLEDVTAIRIKSRGEIERNRQTICERQEGAHNLLDLWQSAVFNRR
jgi:hypothetical protein